MLFNKEERDAREQAWLARHSDEQLDSRIKFHERQVQKLNDELTKRRTERRRAAAAAEDAKCLELARAHLVGLRRMFGYSMENELPALAAFVHHVRRMAKEEK